MNKILQYVMAGLLLYTPVGMAVQLSDLSPSLTRESADENLTKDYAYRVLSDLSVRRIWNLDDNRKLTIDFDGKTGDLICIAVDYRKPVSTKAADKDAADIGKFEEANWRKFSADKAAKYFMGRAKAMKFDEGYMFEELNAANKCIRLSFYPKTPKEDRRQIAEGSTAGGSTAMGSTLSGSAVKKLLEDEEQRLFTANKTDKTEPTKVIKKPVVKEVVEDPEIEEEEPEIVVEEPQETGKIVETPVKIEPVKPVKQKGDRSKDVDSLLARLGLDKLDTMHWIIGGVGLLLLITIISAVGKKNERRKLEKRAERLRQSSTSVQASLRHSVKKGMKNNSRLKL